MRRLGVIYLVVVGKNNSLQPFRSTVRSGLTAVIVSALARCRDEARHSAIQGTQFNSWSHQQPASLVGMGKLFSPAIRILRWKILQVTSESTEGNSV
jgi:hypothetical protein